MSFFDSEFVQKEMDDINELQRKIGKELFVFPTMSKEEKYEHMQLLSDLLEKQQLLYTRLSLSDDPKAIEMKNQIVESSRMLGFGNADVNSIFKSMRMTIENLKTKVMVDP
jgi:hypothetical protein